MYQAEIGNTKVGPKSKRPRFRNRHLRVKSEPVQRDEGQDLEPDPADSGRDMAHFSVQVMWYETYWVGKFLLVTPDWWWSPTRVSTYWTSILTLSMATIIMVIRSTGEGSWRKLESQVQVLARVFLAPTNPPVAKIRWREHQLILSLAVWFRVSLPILRFKSHVSK